MDAIDVMDQMNEIKYGWVDKYGNIHVNDFEKYSDDYILQSPEEVLKSQVGVCWDQVELERHLFEKNGNYVQTYFIVHYDNKNCPTHTFLVFKQDNYLCWFEHSWAKFKGIHKYDSLEELINDVRTKFISCELNNKYDENNLQIHQYEKPNYHISVQEFYKHCENGKIV